MVSIVKASGETEAFSEAKLRESLRSAGASKAEVDRVAAEVLGTIQPGMTTRNLYRLAFKLLRRKNRPSAARYSLRRAIMRLGPTGFPFEKFYGEVLRAEGWTPQFNLTLAGKCVSHEIDVEAKRGGERILVECKHHRRDGTKSDLKVALYIHARALDLASNPEHGPHDFWLVTNTKLTTEAMKYATCAGLHVVAWNHPEGQGLGELVARHRVYPITVLSTLSKKNKELLTERGVVLASQVAEEPKVLRGLRLSDRQRGKLLDEARGVCER